jgi:predicted ABC-type ATPase
MCQVKQVLLDHKQVLNFAGMWPKLVGWQLGLQSIKSLKRELNLKKIIIIAGPNGAGKTTFARDFLPAEAQTVRFINADLIAAGLAPFNPETASFKAGRLMLEEIDECVDAGHSFAFETTLSGLAYLKKIALWQAHGYQVKLWFLSLPNEEIAVSRVARRVLQGGHNIPEDVIRRRFKAGLANFHERYRKVVNSWAFYDSSGMHPKLIDWSNK